MLIYLITVCNISLVKFKMKTCALAKHSKWATILKTSEKPAREKAEPQEGLSMPQKRNINRRRFLKRVTGVAVGIIGFGLGHRLSPRQHIHAARAKFEMGPGEGTLS
jgi:hypothetical protein